ncbi:MAG: hypothetical protein WCR72_16540 [Bacteroidota bacterium]
MKQQLINAYAFSSILVMVAVFLGLDYKKNKENSIIGKLRSKMSPSGIVPATSSTKNYSASNSGSSSKSITNPDSARITPTNTTIITNTVTGRPITGPAPLLDAQPTTRTGPSLYKP